MNMKTLTNFLLIFFTCVLVSNAVASVEQQRRETGTSLHTNSTTISPAVASVYLIDGSVNDIEHLTQHMTSPFYILDTEQPALSQWQAISLRHPQATQWHIVSHGHPGQLLIGNEVWDQAWLQQTESELSLLKSQLAKDAEISLYACDLAKGEVGKGFVDDLARAMNVSISASTNKTGVTAGADTILEYGSSGTLNNKGSISLDEQINFDGYHYTLSQQVLEDWATGRSDERPQGSDYAIAEITGVTGTDDGNIFSGNVNDVNSQLRALNLDDMTLVQPLVDDINAILSFTADAAFLPQPDDDLYNAVGLDAEPDTQELDAIDVTTTEFLNAEAGGSGMTVVEIQALIKK